MKISDAPSLRPIPLLNEQDEAAQQPEVAGVHHCQQREDYDVVARVETIFGKMKNITDVGEAFERLARPLALVLEGMRRVRPDVMGQPFDLVSHGSRLSVVGTKLAAEDCAWIEQVLNADGVLGRLAHGFNDQVVRSYDTDHGIRDAKGALRQTQAFDEGTDGSIDYKGLSDSVDGSVKLMSLLHDVETTSLSGWRSKEHPYQMGGWLVQRYIEGEITEYVRTPDGVDTVRSRRGSILRKDVWW
jgi:hypothetical protein